MSVLRCGITGYSQCLQFNTSAQVKHVLHEGGAQHSKAEGGAQRSKAEGGAQRSKAEGGAQRSKAEGGAQHSKAEGGAQHSKAEGGAQHSRVVPKLPEVSLKYSVSLFITHKKSSMWLMPVAPHVLLEQVLVFCWSRSLCSVGAGPAVEYTMVSHLLCHNL